MNWKKLLKAEIESDYKVAAALFELVDEDQLDYKPSTGNNWMTMGQVIRHITDACGSGFRGFITGDWGLPPGKDINNLPPEEMLPPAEKMPTVKSVAEAKKMLAKDKKLALAMLRKCREKELAHKIALAPWDPSEIVLGHRLLQMVDHLNQHKGQLFYYLKLQGKPVHTGHLWGM
jgi:uncharacterized damage-inducible protein DinB